MIRRCGRARRRAGATLAALAGLLALAGCGDTVGERAATGGIGGAVVGTVLGGPIVGTAAGATVGAVTTPR